MKEYELMLKDLRQDAGTKSEMLEELEEKDKVNA
jgi:hypothetical protein